MLLSIHSDHACFCKSPPNINTAKGNESFLGACNNVNHPFLLNGFTDDYSCMPSPTNICMYIESMLTFLPWETYGTKFQHYNTVRVKLKFDIMDEIHL
jgi:hypothetical protein